MQRIYTVVRIVALLGIVAFLAKQILDGRSTLESLRPDWEAGNLLGAFMLAILAYQMPFAAWLVMLRRTGFYRPGLLRPYARIWWLSFMYRYFPGKILLVTERARLGRTVGIPLSAGAAMPVLETFLSILAGGAVSLLAIAFYAAAKPALLLAILGVMACVVVILPVGLRWLTQRAAIAERFPELRTVSLRNADILILCLPFLAHYLLLGASLFLLARDFYPLKWSEMPGVCGVYALSHVISVVVIVAPGGLGVREGALAVQLEQAIPSAISGALAIGARMWFTIVELLCLSTALLLSRNVIDVDRHPSPDRVR